MSLASHLACACIWSDSGSFLVDGCASLSKDGFQREAVWEVGRAYDGPASPRSFGLSPRLRTSPARALGGAVPLTASVRTLWLLCLSPHQGPVLLLVSCSIKETGGSCSTRGLSLCCLSTTGFAVPAFLTFLPSWGMFPKMVLLLLLLCSKAVHGSQCSGIQAGPALLSGHLPLGPSWHSFSSS